MSLNPEQLRDLIATMLRISPAEIAEGTSLAPLNTSLGAAKVRLGLKRLGLAMPAGTSPATFGGLLAALSGEDSSVAPRKAEPVSKPLPVSGNGGFAGLQVGLDVEDIRSMPAASDYWEHEFYRGSFSKSEIAYAVLHPEPRTHFAGFWCAKEALRKCDPLFAGVAPERTAVAHDADGRPYLTLETEAGPERLAHAVSISHTAEVATAVVVLNAVAAPVVVAVQEDSRVSAQAEAPVTPAREEKKSRGLAKLFGI
jgi:phosphopantetheine--protein transferase-like protein